MFAILGTGEHCYRVIEDWARLPKGRELTDVASVAFHSKDRVHVFNRGTTAGDWRSSSRCGRLISC
jgi:hypothetical protein